MPNRSVRNERPTAFQHVVAFYEIKDRLPSVTDSGLGDSENGCEPNPFGLIDSVDFA